MILIEPAIQKKFGRSSLKKREIGDFLAQAVAAAELAGTVSVLLTGDEEIRRLNREFRHKDKATDVLSFPAARVGRASSGWRETLRSRWRQRRARRRGVGIRWRLELKVLLLHGVLHLAGWDHETDAGEMARKEEALRKETGAGSRD